MTVKQRYRQLCETEESIPLFSRDWWLDITCGEAYWEVIGVEQKGRFVVAMPLYRPLPRVISMPPFTQTMGIWFSPEASDTKYTSMITKRQALSKELIDRLPPFSSFLQLFPYTFTDWLPFYHEGYKQTTRYTYVLPDITDSDRLWENMATNIRRNIIKAKEKNGIVVRKGVPAAEFMEVFEATFLRQGKPVPKDSLLLTQLIDASRRRGQGDLWGGYDETGRLHAVAFIVWQKSSAYYIAGGGNPALRDSGAHSLVVWEAINEVSQHTACFDFEGSMISGIERFFRGFGAKQMPFFTIIKGRLSLVDRIKMKLRKKTK